MWLEDRITISMASIPERRAGMLANVDQLHRYCEHLDLCLNGYTAPDELRAYPNIYVVNSTPDFQHGARGKFFMASRASGYFLTVDDDIEYPEDYVRFMIAGVEKYNRKAVVGLHGQNVLDPKGYEIFGFQEEIAKDMSVHILGTGCMAFHTSALEIDWQKLPEGKIDDAVAALAQDARMPMKVLAHKKDWVKTRPELDGLGALKRNMPALQAAEARIRSRQWKLFTTED